MSKYFMIIFLLMFLFGCSDYSTVEECRVKEEQNGASPDTARNYCNGLAKKGELECNNGKTVFGDCISR